VKLNGWYSVDQRRLAKCPACLFSWPLQADSSGDCVPVIVVDDLARNAAARRRRSGLDAPDLPRIDTTSMKLQPHSPPDQLPKPALSPAPAERFDFSSPLRSNSPIPRRFTEDKTLTRFLKKHIDVALSPSVAPPDCPHCGRADSRLIGKMRTASTLPQFQCRACAPGCSRGPPKRRWRKCCARTCCTQSSRSFRNTGPCTTLQRRWAQSRRSSSRGFSVFASGCWLSTRQAISSAGCDLV